MSTAYLRHHSARRCFQACHLQFRAQDVRLRRGAVGVPRIGGADNFSRKRDLLDQQRCAATPFLQHQKRARRLQLHVERRPVAVGSDPNQVRQRRRTAVPADARQRELLLEREAHVCAGHHERLMIDRGRDHRICEGRDDPGSCFGRADAKTRCTDLIAPLTRDPHGLDQRQR